LGADKNKIVIVGDCALDYVYDKFSNLDYSRQNNKIEILFITSGLVEHGLWSYKQYEEVLTNIVKVLKNSLGNSINLTFKLHPHSEKIKTYHKFLDGIDPTINIFQDVDLFSLIHASDLIIVFDASSALMEAILLKKPIVFITFYGEQFQMVTDYNVAKAVKNPEELVSIIKNGSFLNVNLDSIQKYIHNKAYKFDGRCGERAAMHIISLFDD